MKNLIKSFGITCAILILALCIGTTAFASGVDDANTKSLLHFDGTSFTDEAGNAVTAHGNAQISTEQSKFGGSSGNFTSDNSYLTVDAGSSALDVGTGDFTVDFWVRVPSTLNNLSQLFQNTTSTSLGTDTMAIHVNHVAYNNKISFYAYNYHSTDLMLNSATTISPDTWYHVAICRYNGACTLYINGKAEDTATYIGNANFSLNSYVLGAGLWQSGTNGYMNGSIDEFRISNISRWTSNFTPPTRAYASESVTLNNTTLTFNRIVYIDVNNGSDTSGDGSESNPYAGIRQAMEYLYTNNYKDNVAIVMSDGDYDWSGMATGASYNVDGKFNGMSVSFIPKTLGKVSLYSDIGFEFIMTEIDPNYKIKLQFYGIVFHNMKSDCVHMAGDDLQNGFYNCVFYELNMGGLNKNASNPATLNVQNCLYYNCVFAEQRVPITSGSVVNCASSNTYIEPVNVTHTTCLTNVKIDSNYAISSSGWQNSGTGTNPDGTVANIGVYGGEFSWDNNSTPILTVESVDSAKCGDTIKVNIVINNAKNICAEDLKISYDTSLLKYVGSANADGMKIYKESDLGSGSLRFITACLGKDNAANGDKILLQLTFEAIGKGIAKVDITQGRIADNATLEMDVSDENCGEKTIKIESTGDVNRSGKFTLLDLGIDSWYYGSAISDTDTSKYDTDLDANGVIDDTDLSKIVAEILINSSYTPNN